MSKFSEEQILTIRRLYREGASQQEIAHQFQVNQTAISKIVRGANYRRFAKPETVRLCKDCQAPIGAGEKRCKPCSEKWRLTYFKQWIARSRAAKR